MLTREKQCLAIFENAINTSHLHNRFKVLKVVINMVRLFGAMRSFLPYENQMTRLYSVLPRENGVKVCVCYTYDSKTNSFASGNIPSRVN